MDHSAYRLHHTMSVILCRKCATTIMSPEQILVMDEIRVTKREALVGKLCSGCGLPFLEEPTPTRVKTWREKYDKDVASGQRIPNTEMFDE